MRIFEAPGHGRTRIPVWAWWAGYLVLALLAQERSDGLDFLAPALLISLQTGQWWSAVWMTLFWTLIQEGVGSLAFGSVIFFYAGMYGLFFVSRWLLEPENPAFILLFSLILAWWSWLVFSGFVLFQELPIGLRSPWSWVARQWLAYLFFWSTGLFAFRRWGEHGRV